MIDRLIHEVVDFLELARELVHELFLLISHLMRGNVANRLDIFLYLSGQVAEELIGCIDLVLKIFLRAANRSECFRPELVEVVLKADVLTLKPIKILPILLDRHLLLLGDFLAEGDLREGFIELFV